MKIAFILFLIAISIYARDAQPGADAWLTNAASMPEAYAQVDIAAKIFSTLRAEAIAGSVHVTWRTEKNLNDARIIVSADAPGHWPARDWRTYAMRRSGQLWQTDAPVDSVDVPLIYFAVAGEDKRLVASPMRMAQPRALGLDDPTRLFWPFIEGFEQELEGWRVLAGPELRTGVPAKNGKAALVIGVPAGQRSATLVTTRLRGWFLEEHRASGVSLWLRTKNGVGTASFALLANAFSTNQIISRREQTTKITEQWTRASLPFTSFPRLPLAEVDLFSIELTAKPGTEFLLDDVQLTGRWRVE